MVSLAPTQNVIIGLTIIIINLIPLVFKKHKLLLLTGLISLLLLLLIIFVK